MICLILTKCWADDNNVVKMFVVFFFNQAQNKVRFSTTRWAGEYGCMWFFYIICHSFYLTKKSVDIGQFLKCALAELQVIYSLSRIVR